VALPGNGEEQWNRMGRMCRMTPTRPGLILSILPILSKACDVALHGNGEEQETG